VHINPISPTKKPANVPVRHQPNPPHRILVVEDDLDIRRFNTAMLHHSGYEADGVEDGEVAWHTLQLNHYDLLITDNNMPKVSGLKLLEMIHEAHLPLPVIMATGVLPTAEFTRSPWLKPAALLLKPYTVGELLEAVKNVLNAPATGCEKVASPEL
jgi:DNA-binding response OmpR family regulator